MSLERIQVHLAHRAERHQDIRFVLFGRGDQPPDEFEGSIRADLGHVTTTAGGLEREIDHFCAQSLEQVIQLEWVLMIGGMMVVIRAGDHATNIRCHAQASEGFDDLLLDLIQTDVVNNDIQQVSDDQFAWVVVQAACGQGLVDLFTKGLILTHVMIGLREVQVAGAAGCHQGFRAFGLLFGQRQVAGDQRVGRSHIERQVFGRATAVPVLNFLQADTQGLADGFQ